MVTPQDKTTEQKQTGAGLFYNQTIVAILFVIVIAVPLFYDVRLYSVFDLSKITILSILIFAIVAVWSLKTLTICWKGKNDAGSVRGHVMGGRGERSGFSGYHSSSSPFTMPLYLPVSAFVFVSAIATFFSISPFMSLFGTYKRYDGLVSTLVYVILFYTVVHFIERKRVPVFLDVIISTACVAAVYGIFQHFGLDLYQWSTDFGFGIRVSSTFGHPAFFSAFLIMVIPLVLVKIFSRRIWYQSALYMAILALLLFAFYYTKTRAAFLGLLISSIFFFSLIGKKTLFTHKIRTAVTLSILIGISVSSNISDKTSVFGRFTQDIHSVESRDPDPARTEIGYTDRLGGTMAMRVFQYLTGIEIIKDYPLLGIGPDTLGMLYPQYLSKVYKKRNKQGNFENQNRIHNDILDMAVSRGFLGLGVYVWFIVAYAGMIWKGYRETDGKNKILITGLSSGCLAYFIQNQFSFGHVPIITMIWFLVGLSVIACTTGNPLSNEVIEETKTDIQLKQNNGFWVRRRGALLRPDRLAKTILCGCVMAFMVLLVIGTLTRYKADIYFSRAQKLLHRNSTIEAIENYEMAARHNPFEINYLNVRNEIYLQMAAITLNQKREYVKRGLPESFTHEQATLWLNNTILGAGEVQKLYPEDYRSAFILGQAYHTLGLISGRDFTREAIASYQKAADLYPFKYEIHNKLAQIYNETGRCEKAVYELNEAIRYVPSEPGLHMNLAKTLIKIKRYEDAKQSCNRILELEGNENNTFKQAAEEMLLFLDKKGASKTISVSRDSQG
ncbi:MAG: O-antigen ligase family protein [Candidatus Scalindua sp.]|nr:O-antigen ligase family protein [Candidatus Scalindua sp.]